MMRKYEMCLAEGIYDDGLELKYFDVTATVNY